MNFIIIDFEFTTIEKTALVLISGAITNQYKKSLTIKLKGQPLLLRKESQCTELPRENINSIIRVINRIFKNQPEKKDPILNELNESFLTKHSNLTAEFILNYCKFQNKKPIIITWNGNTDKEILKRLGINIVILNIACYDIYNDGNFYLQITNTDNNKTLLQEYVGKIKKLGRLTNLIETHNIICKENHSKTYLHDPVTDVNLTKCIFNYLNNITPIQNLI